MFVDIIYDFFKGIIFDIPKDKYNYQRVFHLKGDILHFLTADNYN